MGRKKGKCAEKISSDHIWLMVRVSRESEGQKETILGREAVSNEIGSLVREDLGGRLGPAMPHRGTVSPLALLVYFTVPIYITCVCMRVHSIFEERCLLCGLLCGLRELA